MVKRVSRPLTTATLGEGVGLEIVLDRKESTIKELSLHALLSLLKKGVATWQNMISSTSK